MDCPAPCWSSGRARPCGGPGASTSRSPCRSWPTGCGRGPGAAAALLRRRDRAAARHPALSGPGYPRPVRLRPSRRLLPADAGRDCGRAEPGQTAHARRRSRYAHCRSRIAAGGDRRSRRRPGGPEFVGGAPDRPRHGGRRLELGRPGAGGPEHPCGRGRTPRRDGRAGSVARPAGMGRAGARAAAGRPAGLGRRSARPPGRPGAGGGRRAPGTGGLRGGGGGRLRAAPRRGRAECRARRSGHRRGQDHRLCRAGQPVGGEEQRRGLALDLHAQPAEPDRRRTRPALSGPGREGAQGRAAQGAGELSLPAQPRRRRRRRPHPPRGGGQSRPRGALADGDARRRAGRRRPAGLARRPDRPRPDRRAHRPPGRVRLRRLPPLQPLFRRTQRPARPARPHRRRQPRPGHGADGDGGGPSRRPRMPRPGWSSTRATTCSARPIRPSPPI